MKDAWKDSKATELVYVFLKKWLLEHPEFMSNPFYVGGISFGGKIAPIVIHKIIDGNEAGATPSFNIKGYFVGNPITTVAQYDDDTKVDFAHGMGLISHELYKNIKKSCGDSTGFAENHTCLKWLSAFQKSLAGIHPDNILDPECGLDSPITRQAIDTERYLFELETNHMHSLQINEKQCKDYGYFLSKVWLDNVAVQKALGVSKEWPGNWRRCNRNMKPEYAFDIPSPVPYYFNITDKGIRGLVYSGDHDLKANFIGTQAWIKTFNLSITKEWRSWRVNGQVAGYTRSYDRQLTYATVKGGGHEAITDKPKECKAMIQRWISGDIL